MPRDRQPGYAPATVISPDYADALDRARRLRLATSDAHKKAWGQYFTPPELATFMARLPRLERGARVRILDPGAGTGSLGLTLARELLVRDAVAAVELYCVESEPTAQRELQLALAAAQRAFGERFSARNFARDFLQISLPPIDIAIANPPYFKMSPSDERGGDAPNIYARFMEVAAGLLREGGQLCFVIPRSYASGHYFRRFRRRFHEFMRLEHVHVFESRRATFSSDDVLQENIVVLYSKQPPAPTGKVTISVSEGIADLAERRTLACVRREVVSEHEDSIVSLPTSRAAARLMRRIQALPNTLEDLGLRVSTGPVVPFRATELLAGGDCEEPTVPLLWLQHVRPGQVTWPLGRRFRKHEHIRLGAGAKLLVPAGNYVVLRRFSAKEEQRRLTAAPLLARDWAHAAIGLENHLNYIHRPGTGLTVDEAQGLSALLNSRVLDQFFRIASGNTQVSATELRMLRLPNRAAIERLGRTVKGQTSDAVESMIAAVMASA
jgi:adenine-specific DNA-methyltransferase